MAKLRKILCLWSRVRIVWFRLKNYPVTKRVKIQCKLLRAPLPSCQVNNSECSSSSQLDVKPDLSASISQLALKTWTWWREVRKRKDLWALTLGWLRCPFMPQIESLIERSETINWLIWNLNQHGVALKMKKRLELSQAAFKMCRWNKTCEDIYTIMLWSRSSTATSMRKASLYLTHWRSISSRRQGRKQRRRNLNCKSDSPWGSSSWSTCSPYRRPLILSRLAPLSRLVSTWRSNDLTCTSTQG